MEIKDMAVMAAMAAMAVMAVDTIVIIITDKQYNNLFIMCNEFVNKTNLFLIWNANIVLSWNQFLEYHQFCYQHKQKKEIVNLISIVVAPCNLAWDPIKLTLSFSREIA